MFSNLTVKELQECCRARAIRGYSKKRRQVLIDLLDAYELAESMATMSVNDDNVWREFTDHQLAEYVANDAVRMLSNGGIRTLDPLVEFFMYDEDAGCIMQLLQDDRSELSQWLHEHYPEEATEFRSWYAAQVGESLLCVLEKKRELHDGVSMSVD